MLCENCGRVLTPQSDPLCGGCLHELRAGPMRASTPDDGPSSITRIDSGRLGVGGGGADNESAA